MNCALKASIRHTSKELLIICQEKIVVLSDRKFAIVCNDTNEIIFTISSREGVEDAKNLECPKCYKPIGSETLMAYYKVTEDLKKLLDGSRWMPLLVRDAFDFCRRSKG